MADGDSDYSPYLARNVREILDSDRFVLDSLRERDLKVSQALCLLWHVQETGDVPGRRTSAPLFGSVTAAIIIDLIVLGKIDYEDDQTSRKKRTKTVLKVIDFTPTNSYLDDCLFNQMIKHACENPDKLKTAAEWILKGSNVHNPSCATATFDSLVKLGLFGKETKFFGAYTKFPCLDPGPQNALINEVQMIGLSGHIPDSFTWTVLKLARFADSLILGGAPMLKHLFNGTEYDDAKKRIQELIEVKKCEVKARRAGLDEEFDNLFDIETDTN